MKNARPQNSETSAPDNANHTKINRAAAALNRFMAVAHPDCALLAALVCLLLGGALW